MQIKFLSHIQHCPLIVSIVFVPFDTFWPICQQYSLLYSYDNTVVGFLLDVSIIRVLFVPLFLRNPFVKAEIVSADENCWIVLLGMMCVVIGSNAWFGPSPSSCSLYARLDINTNEEAKTHKSKEFGSWPPGKWHLILFFN